jgi:Holliday junction resolvase-like predicted endonuclease
MICAPVYNAGGDRANEMLEPLGIAAATSVPAVNFLPWVLSIDAYCDAHAFLAEEFRQKRAYSLRDFLLVIAALSWRVVYPERSIVRSVDGDPRAFPFAMLNVLRRAYAVVDPNPESVRSSVLWYMENALNCDQEEVSRIDARLDDIIADVSLDSKEKQAAIALWTRGPRFMLLPGPGMLTIDAQGVIQMLNTLFVRLRHSEQQRGMTFEDLLRSELHRKGFDLLQRRFLLPDGPREVDAVIRVGDTLWLIEAHSMERPLDFEIGKPNVIEQRNQRFASKLEQVASVRSALAIDQVGKNYDVRWATKIEHCVVSPFVEWIWARDAALWIDEHRPRILSVAELPRVLGSDGTMPVPE